MTVSEWIAVATIAAPLFAKAFSDWNANAVANHNLALARITGMAGREAATIGRTLSSLQPGADAQSVETALIQSSVASILTEMGSSSATVGADSTKVAAILQGEINKVVSPAAIAGAPRPPLTRERLIQVLSTL